MYLFIILYIILFYFKLHLCLFVRAFVCSLIHSSPCCCFKPICWYFLFFFSVFFPTTLFHTVTVAMSVKSVNNRIWFRMTFGILVFHFLVNYSFYINLFMFEQVNRLFKTFVVIVANYVAKPVLQTQCLEKSWRFLAVAHIHVLWLCSTKTWWCALKGFSQWLSFSVKWKEEQPEEPQHGRAASE